MYENNKINILLIENEETHALKNILAQINPKIYLCKNLKEAEKILGKVSIDILLTANKTFIKEASKNYKSIEYFVLLSLKNEADKSPSFAKNFLFMDASEEIIKAQFDALIKNFVLNKEGQDFSKNSEKELLKKININVLNLLVLVEIKDFLLIKNYYDNSLYQKLEKHFGDSLLIHFNKNIFTDVYFLSEGRFAFVCDLDAYMDMHLNLENFVGAFLKNVNDSYLYYKRVQYDFNIFLSYCIGKNDLFKDAVQGLKQALIKKKDIYYANDASLVYTKKSSLKDVRFQADIHFDEFKLQSYNCEIINNKTKEVEYYESFLRLMENNKDTLFPYDYLHLLKKQDNTIFFNKRILEYSFEIAKKISTSLTLYISVLDIENEEIRNYIFTLLHNNRYYCNRIIFTIIDDDKTRDFILMNNFIQSAKDLGIRFSLENFIHSSFSFERLLLFKPDILKIDSTLINNLCNSPLSMNFLRTANEFAKIQNIKTIAAYVKEVNIFEALNSLDIKYSQGKKIT